MASQYGLQPNGMVRLDNGIMWDPSGPLPADPTAFNATPMGNPLQPQSLPREITPPSSAPTPPASASGPLATITPPIPTMSGASAAPPIGPGRMMFAGMPKPAVPAAPPAPQNIIPAASAQPAGSAPSFFAQGGTGRDLVGILGDMLSVGTGHQGSYFPAMDRQRQQAWQAKQDAYKQSLEFQRQAALAAYNNSNKDDRTTLQKDAEASGLAPGTPEYSSFIRDATMAPVITTVDGKPMAYSRQQLNAGITGVTGSASPSYPRVTDAASYGALKSGDHFLDPAGNVRVKP